MDNINIMDETIITRTKALKYLKLARYQAELFSKDTTKVGCIIIDKDNYSILSSGYNGFIRGASETAEKWERPEKYTWVIHAEANMLYNAARCGIKVDKSIAFTTMFPCCDCAKALIQSGISSLITLKPNLNSSKWSKSFEISLIMFNESNIKIMFITNEELDNDLT